MAQHNADQFLLTTKLAIPPARSGLVARPRGRYELRPYETLPFLGEALPHFSPFNKSPLWEMYFLLPQGTLRLRTEKSGSQAKQNKASIREEVWKEVSEEMYQIRVKGHLDQQRSSYLDGLTIKHEVDGNSGETVLSGPIRDQKVIPVIHSLNSPNMNRPLIQALQGLLIVFPYETKVKTIVSDLLQQIR